MTLLHHSPSCLQFGLSGTCPVCHPEPTCKNCGHGASAHSYSEPAATFGWCPNCRGCGSRQEQEAKPMKHLQIFTVDGRIHYAGLGGDEAAAVELLKRGMSQGLTLEFTTDMEVQTVLSGSHIVAFRVLPGPAPVEPNL